MVHLPFLPPLPTARLVGAAVGAWLLALPMALAGPPCAVALLLAIDVSGSVSAPHYALQRDATAAALRSAPVGRAAADGLRVGALMWGSGQHMVVSFGTDPLAAAARLEAVARPESGQTDMAGAIRVGTAALLAEPCERRVLDISGDGPHNAGPVEELDAAVAAAVAAGIEINALPILTESEPGLGEWFRAHVTGPAGGFVIEAAAEAFARAIRAKLALEIAGR